MLSSSGRNMVERGPLLSKTRCNSAVYMLMVTPTSVMYALCRCTNKLISLSLYVYIYIYMYMYPLNDGPTSFGYRQHGIYFSSICVFRCSRAGGFASRQAYPLLSPFPANMYVCIHACVHICTMCICAYVPVHTCVLSYVHAYMYAYMHMIEEPCIHTLPHLYLPACLGNYIMSSVRATAPRGER